MTTIYHTIESYIMRNFELTAVSFLLFTFLAGPVKGQDKPCYQSLVEEYFEDSHASRTDAWWNALGRQLTLSIDGSIQKISQEAIGDLIFFATHHGHDVNLTDATERLLRIYFEHDVVGIRVMAVAALNAIGDNNAIQQLKKGDDGSSQLLRHVTIAALRDRKIQ